MLWPSLGEPEHGKCLLWFSGELSLCPAGETFSLGGVVSDGRPAGALRRRASRGGAGTQLLRFQEAHPGTEQQ